MEAPAIVRGLRPYRSMGADPVAPAPLWGQRAAFSRAMHPRSGQFSQRGYRRRAPGRAGVRTGIDRLGADRPGRAGGPGQPSGDLTARQGEGLSENERNLATAERAAIAALARIRKLWEGQRAGV